MNIETGEYRPKWMQNLNLRGIELPGGIPTRPAGARGRRSFRLGYGSCARPGCSCRHYEGSTSTCGCGHTLAEHW